MHPDVLALIETLGLQAHPEGGYFRETFRSPQILGDLPQGGPRHASTAIYFLLPSGQFSAWHRVCSDEAWHVYDGDPLALHLLADSGAYSCLRLGRDLRAGQRPQAIVPAGVWQAAEPLGERFTLCGCTVAPGFDFADFELPARQDLQARMPQHAELIRRFTRPQGSGGS